jgi:hypothetical protein
MWHLAFMVNRRGSKCNVDVGDRILTNSKNGPTFSASFITTILLGKLRRRLHLLLLLLSLEHHNSLKIMKTFSNVSSQSCIYTLDLISVGIYTASTFQTETEEEEEEEEDGGLRGPMSLFVNKFAY